MAGPCQVNFNCFEVDYDPAGVILRPAIDPSPENGLVCRPGPQPGLWDPDEKVSVFCKTIHGFISGNFNQATNITLPIFVPFTVTNPSPTMSADVFFAWGVEDSRIVASPGTRGTVVTRSSVFPNPHQDVGYHVLQHGYDQTSGMTIPGAAASYVDCPVRLPPGGSRTWSWSYRFEGAGAPGAWSAEIGSLKAYALVVTVPS